MCRKGAWGLEVRSQCSKSLAFVLSLMAHDLNIGILSARIAVDEDIGISKGSHQVRVHRGASVEFGTLDRETKIAHAPLT
jgi:hypothetical protein